MRPGRLSLHHFLEIRSAISSPIDENNYFCRYRVRTRPTCTNYEKPNKNVMYKIFSLYLILLIITECGQTSDDGWTNLFNGQDLSGWHQLNGEAIYEVEDGMIVGTTVANTPNSFLATDENYGDFIFE